MAQTIFRNAGPTKPYTMIVNGALQDPELTSEAGWILVFMLSQSPMWKTNLEAVARRRRMGRDRAQKAVGQLIERGYCKRVAAREKDGRVAGYEYWFTDVPHVFATPEPKDQAAARAPEPEVPAPELPAPVLQWPYKGRKREKRIGESDSPPLPPAPRRRRRSPGGRESEVPNEDPVVRLLLCPVLSKVPFDDRIPDPAGAHADLSRWAADVSHKVLTAAAAAVLRSRSYNVRVSHFIEAVRAECRLVGEPPPVGEPGIAARGVTVNQGAQPQAFSAWLSHMRASTDPHTVRLADRWEREGSMLQPTLMPA